MFAIVMDLFLENFIASCRVNGMRAYSIFTFKQLRYLHPGLSKLLKTCTVNYLSLDRV